MRELDEVIKNLEFILDITESDLTDNIEKLKVVKKRLEAINVIQCYAGETEQLCVCKETKDDGWYGDAIMCKCGGLYID